MADDMKQHKAESRHPDNRRNSSLGGRHGIALLFFARRRLAVFCSLCLLSASAAAAGETLRDPTRPPAALHAGEGAEIDSGPTLQSIRLLNGQYTAVISGETVKVGSKYGEARVVKIKETEVVLKTGDSFETLKLFPDVEKRPAANNKRSKR